MNSLPKPTRGRKRHWFETRWKDPSCHISAHMATQNDRNESVLFSLS